MNSDIVLKEDQQIAIDSMKAFVKDDCSRVFILKGYAGTGKTTLMRFFIEHLETIKKHYILLASTGRAAKILSNLTHTDAQTIHSLIYKLEDLNKDLSEVDEEPDGQLYLSFKPTSINDNLPGQTIYIVDESSMISDTDNELIVQAQFGSGRLLKELLDYDKRPESKFIFIGDPCQLPPIDSTGSPALSSSYISRNFNLNCKESQLSEIIRQGNDNAIITASQDIRDSWERAPDTKSWYGERLVWGKLNFSIGKDIHLYENTKELISKYTETIKRDGYNQATMICRSNNKCYSISIEIRKRLEFNGAQLHKGDLLLVIQNNLISGLMNGDMVEVTEVDSHTELVAGLTFRKISVKELFSGCCYSQLLIEDIINQRILNLSPSQQKALFWDFIKRMKRRGIKQKDKLRFQKAMCEDPYLNALRCVFGYAITCHKSQGGEWKDVFIYFPRNITANPTKSTYQWIYTAITRATERLHIVNDFFINSVIDKI